MDPTESAAEYCRIAGSPNPPRPAKGRHAGAGQPRDGSAGQAARSLCERGLHKAEIADLEAFFSNDLQDEITLLRVLMRRLFSRVSAAGEELDIDDLAKTLGILGLTTTRLAGLLKTQQAPRGPESDTARAISQALSEVVKELGLE